MSKNEESTESINPELENVIIKGGSAGNGILDYHAWRFFEVLGIYGATLLGIFSIRRDPTFIWTGVGAILMGMFIYERVLNYVDTGTVFKEPGWIFYIGGIEIPRYPWQDVVEPEQYKHRAFAHARK